MTEPSTSKAGTAAWSEVVTPTLTTDRLTLRPQRLDDFEAYSELLTSDRCRFMGGPHDSTTAWLWFASDIVQWRFFGHGGLAVVENRSGVCVGQVVLNRLPGFPERELGWMVYEEFEGNGYMTEAAACLKSYAFETLGLSTLVSYISRENVRSIALAKRIGGRVDPEADGPEPYDLVYRYQVEEFEL